jgi:hypothetical protein
MSSPDSMISFGAKSALVKLSSTGLVPHDTYAYFKVEDFRSKFP